MWQPFGNSTTTSTPLDTWKSSPDERGTLSILISCIFTLILCLYQSLHLNIPRHGKSTWFPKLKSRVKWGVMGLLFPEYIVCIAVRQWLFARKVQRQMGKHLDSLTSSAKSDIEQNATYDSSEAISTSESATHLKEFRWTKTHSQFALMGGFMFDTRALRVNILPNGRTSLTLTFNALRKLAKYEPSIIPDISVGTIRDKSKADWLARLLVFIQLCWFMSKVIERLKSRYPISLLELGTFIHALFCFVFYTAWWNKPFDIEEPHAIKLDTDLKRKVCAWMVMNSELGVKKQVYSSSTSGNMWAYLKYVKDHKPTSAAEIPNQAEVHPNDAILEHRPDTKKLQKLLKLQLGQTLHGFRLEFAQSSGNDKSSNACAYLTTDEIECIRLAKSLRESSSANDAWKFEWSVEPDDRKGMLTKQISLTASLHYDGSTDDSNDSKRPLRLNCSSEFVFKVALGLFGSIYGGLHLFAWDAPFPTRTECWLWRISGIWIASFPIFGIIAAFEVLVPAVLGDMPKIKGLLIVRLLCRLGDTCFEGIEKILNVYMIMWLIARLFLIAECFASLRQLPAAVYEEPEWTRLIPHFAAG